MKAGYDLERELLKAAGITDEDKVQEYKSKLELIDARFHEYLNDKNLGQCRDGLVLAKALHRYFFDSKPKRAVETRGRDNRLPYALLDRVIDAELGSGKGVGNCSGLAALYSVIGRRNGLKLSVMASPTHISSRLDYEGNKVGIENTCRSGFGRQPSSSSVEHSLGMLVSAAYLNQGVQKINEGFFAEGIGELDKAITADSGNYLAFRARGKAKEKQGNLFGAVADYRKALKINPSCEKASAAVRRVQEKLGAKYSQAADDAVLNEGGNARLAGGNLLGAMADYRKALKLNPENGDARANMETANEMLHAQYESIQDEPAGVQDGKQETWQQKKPAIDRRVTYI